MRGLMLLPLALATVPAAAAEVVWLTPVFDGGTLEAAILAEARPARGRLGPTDLIAAAGDAARDDRAARDALERTLSEVREYETRLDGELLIMDDLERALDRVAVLGSEADRDLVFRALAYQGFAVHRFFEDILADDDRAEPFRVTVNGITHVRPWARAQALEPDRRPTAYEIAESPQRIAYGEQADVYGDEVLPGTLVVDADGWVDQGAAVVIDGLPVSGTEHKLLPGTHWVHLDLQGHVVDLGRVEVDSGRTTTWAPAPRHDAWTAWLGRVRAGEQPSPTEAVIADVQALGGEVWFVVDGDGGPRVHALTAEPGVAPTWRTVEIGGGAAGGRDGDEGGFGLSVGVGVGWLYSGDFYTQDPVNAPHSAATVNSLALDLDVQATYDVGPVRLGAGIDTLLTPGEHHVALTGDNALRVRPTPYLAVGHPLAQATVGWLLPYHPALGARGQIPLPVGPEGLEVQARAWLGLPGTMDPNEGDDYQRRSLTALQVGIGYGW